MTKLIIVLNLILTSLILACSNSNNMAGTKEEVLSSLQVFINAFENGDIDTMENCLAENATTFPLAIMDKNFSLKIDKNEYKRVGGLEPKIRVLCEWFKDSGETPPYMSLEPKDIDVTILNDAALVTFHFEDDTSVGRRTFVLQKTHKSWKILHLHASEVVNDKE